MAAEKFSLEWWCSDDAYEHRCAEYLGEMLLRQPGAFTLNSYSREEKFGMQWPAILHYILAEDRWVWIRCDHATKLKDFARAYPDRINISAKEFLADPDRYMRAMRGEEVDA